MKYKIRKRVRKIINMCGIIMTVLVMNTTAFAESYEYDELNRVTKVTYDDGSYVTYVYDNNGNVIDIIVYEVETEKNTEKETEKETTEESKDITDNVEDIEQETTKENSNSSGNNEDDNNDKKEKDTEDSNKDKNTNDINNNEQSIADSGEIDNPDRL